MSKPGEFKANLPELAQTLLRQGPRKVIATTRRVRIIHKGSYILDTTQAVHVWEHDFYPQFYFPRGELKDCSVREKEEVKTGDGQVGAAIVEIDVESGGDHFKNDRIISFVDDTKIAGSLAGLTRVEFGSADQWLEEDLPIYVHPRDPYKRIETLPSSRAVEVKVDGQTIAKSSHSVHLLETMLPTRYYLPLTSVDLSVLRPSDTITQCPYKGDANYHHVVVNGKEYRDLVWYYKLPTHESDAVARLLCFYNEKVDIYLDGKQLERPKTHFG